MKTTRLEAFSDGVIAIIITIMVLELKVPHDPDPAALWKLWPVFLSYVLSFVNVGIYWVNHHHLLHLARKVTKGVLWSNLALLFFLSLIPFTTAYMGENHFTPFSVALYGVDLIACGIGYYVLLMVISRQHLADARMMELHGTMGRKNMLAIALYAAGIALAFAHPAISLCIYGLIAAAYFFPDRRVEQLQSGGH